MSVRENPKKIQIINTANSLFMKYGIRRVSVEELCREAGVSKMTFYKYFKNKKDLVKSLILQFVSEGMEKYRNTMAQNIPYMEKVKRIIQQKMDGTENLSQEFVTELSRNVDPEIADFYNTRVQETLQAVMQDLIDAQKQGDVRKDIRPEFILYFLNHMIDLANESRLMALYPSPQALIMELANFFFYGILPRDENHE